MNDRLLSVEHLRRYFSNTKAVDDVSFEIGKGETFALVGESGSGKTTIGRTILKLAKATEGKVFFKGRDILEMKERELRGLRPQLQMIFQDPYSSLDPAFRIGDLIREAVHEHHMVPKDEEKEYVISVMEECGLSRSMYDMYPDEFSGGERQRIAIARAMALKPELIIADEPVSALDVTVEAQILSLMQKLKKEKGLSYLFISHDMKVIRLVSDRIGVMYRGKLVEVADKEELFLNPLHPYTRLLLEIDENEIASTNMLKAEEAACPFYSRCPLHMEICRRKMPEEKDLDGHRILCHLF